LPTFYVETGALFKRYRQERGSDVVHELLEHQRTTDAFVTSHLTMLEMHAIAARLLKGRVLRRRGYDRLVARLATDFEKYAFKTLPLEERYVDAALALYPQHTLRAPDALHFVTALRVRDAVGQANFCLVSGDRDIVEAAHAAEIRLIDPEDAGALDRLRALR
jgi:predicted nucleic acid-binding protein